MDAWVTLSTARNYGPAGGALPIRFADHDLYAQRKGLTGEEYWRFVDIMQRVDEAYLLHRHKVSEEQRKRKERTSRQRRKGRR